MKNRYIIYFVGYVLTLVFLHKAIMHQKYIFFIPAILSADITDIAIRKK